MVPIYYAGHPHCFIKESKSSTFVSWHQDGNYWGLSSNEVTTAWLALTPSTVLNGCVKMIPGSHNWPQIHHEPSSNKKQSIITRPSNE